ncbi:MAG: ZIP family metal transporter [bacterium]
MDTWFYTITSVVIVSVISLVGFFAISFKKERLDKALSLFVSFAVGGLLGDAFIHLIPESFANIESELYVSLLIILGMIIFFVLEKFICWHHCRVTSPEQHRHPVATMNLIGDGIHNALDGVVIAVSYMVSIPLGIATSLAVIFHEIPQEIGDFGVLIYAGFSKKKALLFNLFSALAAVIAAVIALAIGPEIEGYSFIFLPITAGGFIYIAGSDLIPELHRETKKEIAVWQFLSILLGIAIMVSLLLWAG